jgi:RimJ/RimL family protein N-acetyltransferase
LTLDYLDRAYHRGCRIVGERASIEWSWERETLSILEDGESRETTVLSDPAPTYRYELEEFLAGVANGSAGGVPGEDAMAVLAVIDAARLAADRGRKVELVRPQLRPAVAGDAAAILAWRNDQETRRWSRSERAVSPAEHGEWLTKALADPSVTLWIGELDGEPVGQVRATRDGDVCELHVALAPNARARGIGSEMLIAASAEALADPGVKRLLAHAKPENTASLRAFERSGFTAIGHDPEGLVRLERVPC